MTDNPIQCAGPGRHPARRCDMPAVSGDLCGSHRRQELKGQELKPLKPHRKREPGARPRLQKYGISFETKTKLNAFEKLVKATGQTAHDFLSNLVNDLLEEKGKKETP
ncbi:hypothetical protein NVS55_40205 (plasmid) [Myxococcus stipitatus]|uniref:hypothetical protein n=1 Tax=Myxococcus stipitatus TaxID=83455 RepID=UPI003145514F